MTCHQLRLYFEDPLRMDAEFPGEAEHLAHRTEYLDKTCTYTLHLTGCVHVHVTILADEFLPVC